MTKSKLITPKQGIIGADNSKKSSDDKKFREIMANAQKPEFQIALENPDPKKLAKAINEFVTSDKDYNKEALDNYQILNDAKVIVKLFRYEEADGSLYDEKGNKGITKLLIKPYVKILKASDKFKEDTGLKEGDILLAPDDITIIEDNISWLEYNYRMSNERPQPTLEEPARYVGKVLDWRKNYMFITDKNNPSKEDLWTFFLPIHLFDIMVDPEMLITKV